MLSPERRRGLARTYLLIAAGFGAVAGVLAVLAVAVVINPDAFATEGDESPAKAIALVAFTAFLTLLAVILAARGRRWRQTLTLSAPLAVGTATVVDVQQGRHGTTVVVDVDHSGRWRLHVEGLIQDRQTLAGHRINVEWYSLDKTTVGAFWNPATGAVKAFSAGRPRQ